MSDKTNHPTLYSSQSLTNSIEMSRITGEVSATHEIQNKHFDYLAFDGSAFGEK